MHPRVPVPCAVAALLLGSARAHAHLAATGLGPIYDGISHLFLSVEDLLPVLAIMLLAGLNGPASARWAVFMLPTAWLAGGMAGFHGGFTSATASITALSLLLLGILVAADIRLKPLALAALAAILGSLHGGSNGAEIALAGREASAVAGIVGAVFVVSVLVAAAVISLRVPWARIVVRVAGSWTAATGLLLLGWSLSGRG
jgi:hydrogenase/urease accessory protein HupE